MAAPSVSAKDVADSKKLVKKDKPKQKSKKQKKELEIQLKQADKEKELYEKKLKYVFANMTDDEDEKYICDDQFALTKEIYTLEELIEEYEKENEPVPVRELLPKQEDVLLKEVSKELYRKLFKIVCKVLGKRRALQIPIYVSKRLEEEDLSGETDSKRIYLSTDLFDENDNMNEEKVSIFVIAHEAAHIKHKHCEKDELVKVVLKQQNLLEKSIFENPDSEILAAMFRKGEYEADLTATQITGINPIDIGFGVSF